MKKKIIVHETADFIHEIIVQIDNEEEEEDDWNRRYFAKVVDKKVATFMDGRISWTSDGIVIDWEYAKLPENIEI